MQKKAPSSKGRANETDVVAPFGYNGERALRPLPPISYGVSVPSAILQLLPSPAAEAFQCPSHPLAAS